MNALFLGSTRFTEVVVNDDPGASGAHHEYQVNTVPANEQDLSDSVARISFQNGPVKESGINGCHHEDLLAIVAHRLQCFQNGPYSCRENALALAKIEEAMHWLNARTTQRQVRGVEGTLVV